MTEYRKIDDEALAAFGARVAGLRNAAGMTRQQLAEALQITASYVGFFERGERMAGPSILIKLADVFKTTTDDLLGRAGTDGSRSLWLTLAKRVTGDERAYRRLAEKSWEEHRYTDAIRQRAFADGLADARESMLRVLAEPVHIVPSVDEDTAALSARMVGERERHEESR